MFEGLAKMVDKVNACKGVDLMPCPFCGGEAIFFPKVSCPNAAGGLTRSWEFSVGCLACGITLPKETYRFSVQMGKDGSINVIEDDRQEAADAWNRRYEGV